MNILLADDDTDDCSFFEKALEELQLSTHLTIVRDGNELMDYLSENSKNIPDVLFLDLSMPRKNGLECLWEIEADENLKQMTVVMYSTSYSPNPIYEMELINSLLKLGAHHYIRKPGDFAQLKEVIHRALTMVAERKSMNV